MSRVIKVVFKNARLVMLISVLIGSAGAVDRISLPYGVTFESFHKIASSPEAVTLVFDADVMFYDTLPSRVADKVKEKSLEAQENVKHYFKKGAEKAKEGMHAVQNAFNKVLKTKEPVKTKKESMLASAKEVIQEVKEVASKVVESGSEIVEAGWNKAKEVAGVIEEKISQQEDKDEQSSEATTVIPTKYVLHGTLVVLNKINGVHGYPVYVVGNMSDILVQDLAKKNPALFDRITDVIVTDTDRLDRESVIKVVNATDAYSPANRSGKGSHYILFISRDEEALRTARQHGFIALKYEGMRKLVSDLDRLGLPTPNKLYDFSS